MGDMKRTSLHDSLWTHLSHGFEYIGSSITGYTLYLYADLLEILQVFFQVTQSLAFGQAVEDGHLDIIVPIKQQTDLVGKVGAVD